MTTALLRAPGSGSADWTWDLTGLPAAGLAEVELADRLAETTTAAGLLEPGWVECHWLLPDGTFAVPVVTEVPVAPGSRLSEAVPALLTARPESVPADAVPRWLRFGGPGIWIAADGRRRVAEDLLMVSVDLFNPDVQLQVFHDVWMSHDFHSVPHPEVHTANAPRLAALLEQISGLLGVAAEPGEPTGYATPVGYTVRNATTSAGRIIDLGDRVVPDPGSA